MKHAEETLEIIENTRSKVYNDVINTIHKLSYYECIYLLNSLHNVPADLLKAIINRAKSLKGNTVELLTASFQCLVNN